MGTAATDAITLRTPFSGRTFQIVGSPDDISVFGATKKASGFWEPQIMRLMSRLVRPGHVCLDIGANLGAHTLALAELARGGAVYAFEPSTVNMSFLAQNVGRNGLDNVRLQKLALGAQAGTQSFTHLVGMEGCSFLTPNDPIEDVLLRSWGQNLDRITEDVLVITLDQWAENNMIDKIDFVKMDVEGSELSVIEGGTKTLGRFRPPLILEFNKHALNLYYGINPKLFFDRLTDLYSHFYIIPDSQEERPRRIASFADIASLIDNPQHWWVDMLCLAAPFEDVAAREEGKSGPAGWLKSIFGQGA